MPTETAHIYEFGPFRLDAGARLLLREDEPVPLTPKAVETLLALVERPGRVVGREELIREVWPDTFVEENNLSVNVSALRKVLGTTPDGKPYIETLPRRGYRFAAEVRTVDGNGGVVVVERGTREQVVLIEEEQEGESSLGPAEPELEKAGPPALAGRVPKRRRLALAFVAALAVATAAGLFFYLRPRGETKRAASAAGIESLAVLPLKPLGPEAQGESYLGTGLADALITRLSRLNRIGVRPTSAVLRFDRPQQNSLAAARALGVDAVLEGSYQRAGERIRVTVQLVGARDGAQLWSGTFDDKFTNIFAVQDSISEQVAGALSLDLARGERHLLTKRYTENTEAYREYLKGRYFWNKRTVEGFRQSLRHFANATDIDPGYALAYAGMADSYALLASRGQPADESAPKAKAAAVRALEMDEALAEAHASLGYIKSWLEWDWPGAEAEYRRAIELDPNCATARHWFGEYLVLMGRFDEGFRELELARRADPLSVIISLDLGKMHFFARQPDLAIEQLRKTLEMEPQFSTGWLFLAMAYNSKGMREEAMAILRKEIERDGKERTIFKSVLGYFHAVSGRAEEARAVLEELKSRGAPAFEIALVHAGLGQREQALDWLEEAYARRDPFLIYIKVDPNLDGLRPDPRFQNLLRRVGLGQ